MGTDTDTDIEQTEAPKATEAAVDPQAPPVITLGRFAVTLVPCTLLQSLSLYVDESAPAYKDLGYRMAVGAAAMAACWPKDKAWPVAKRPRPWRMGVPAPEYGGPIFEDLAEGLTDVRMSVLGRALEDARRWADRCTLREADVRAAQGFSKASADQATPGA